jgi:hypothetical protein
MFDDNIGGSLVTEWSKTLDNRKTIRESIVRVRAGLQLFAR